MDLDVAQPPDVATNQDGNHQRGGDHRKEKEHGLSGCGKFGHWYRCFFAQAGIAKVPKPKADQGCADKKDTCREEDQWSTKPIVEGTSECHSAQEARLGEKKAAGHDSTPNRVRSLPARPRDWRHEVNRTGGAAGEQEYQGRPVVLQQASECVR